MTDGQYYGARKLRHNIAAIYCCVCHRPYSQRVVNCLKQITGRFAFLFEILEITSKSAAGFYDRGDSCLQWQSGHHLPDSVIVLRRFSIWVHRKQSCPCSALIAQASTKGSVPLGWGVWVKLWNSFGIPLPLGSEWDRSTSEVFYSVFCYHSRFGNRVLEGLDKHAHRCTVDTC